MGAEKGTFAKPLDETDPLADTHAALGPDPATAAPRPVSGAYRSYVLGLLLVVYVFNFLDRQILAILLEPIKQEFALSHDASHAGQSLEGPEDPHTWQMGEKSVGGGGGGFGSGWSAKMSSASASFKITLQSMQTVKST